METVAAVPLPPVALIVPTDTALPLLAPATIVTLPLLPVPFPEVVIELTPAVVGIVTCPPVAPLASATKVTLPPEAPAVAPEVSITTFPLVNELPVARLILPPPAPVALTCTKPPVIALTVPGSVSAVPLFWQPVQDVVVTAPPAINQTLFP